MEAVLSGKGEWRLGALHEVSPRGTGFIEDRESGRCFGFHQTMLKPSIKFKPQLWEGAAIRFHLDAAGRVDRICLP